MAETDKLPTVRYYWRSSKKGVGQVRAYLNDGGRKTYGGVTGCYITTNEWEALNTDGSLKNPQTASEELQAISRMLTDLRLMTVALELKIQTGFSDLFFESFAEEMKYILSEYLKKQLPRKTDISAIVDRLMSETNRGDKEARNK